MSASTRCLVVALTIVAFTGAARADIALNPDACFDVNPLGLTFFPTGFENMNEPSAWTKLAQLGAGNSDDDRILEAVLSHHPMPSLQVLPVHFLMNNGANVPTSCFMQPPKALNASRKLLQNDALTALNYSQPANCVELGGSCELQQGASAQSVTVVKPAAFTLSYKLGERPQKDWGMQDKSPYNSTENPPPRMNITEVPNLEEGRLCMVVSVTLLGASATLKDSTTMQTFVWPPTDKTVTRTICFNVIAKRPDAKIVFQSCRPSFSVNISDLNMKPLMAGNNKTLMYQPVVIVSGQLVKNLDGSNASLAYTGQQRKMYYKQYIVVEPNSNMTVYTLNVPDLQDGLWDFTVEGSLTSSIPTLLSASGEDTYKDSDFTGLFKKRKFLGSIIYSGSIPIVNAESSIMAVLGPAQPVAPGGYARFTWKVVGEGNTTCTLAGTKEVVTNAPNGQCVSPLMVPVANETLVVSFTDKCGKRTDAFVDFGTWGSKLDPVKTNASSAAILTVMPPSAPSTKISANANANANATKNETKNAGNLALPGWATILLTFLLVAAF